MNDELLNKVAAAFQSGKFLYESIDGDYKINCNGVPCHVCPLTHTGYCFLEDDEIRTNVEMVAKGIIPEYFI